MGAFWKGQAHCKIYNVNLRITVHFKITFHHIINKLKKKKKICTILFVVAFVI